MDELYQITDDDVNKLIKQTVITRDKARELLIKNNGDMVQCILDNCNFKDDIKNNKSSIYKSRDNNHTQEKFGKMNHIIDEKNKLYQNMLRENQVNSNQIKII